jgi:nicotinamide-nucleotide amidase
VTAEIVSVGTELLLGQIVDTHAPVMARLLAECGISCTRRATIGDNWDRLLGALKEALDRADVVVTIGGLGPTVDDLTRDAIAAALDDKLEVVPEYEAELRAFFASRNYPMSPSTARQAQKPTSASLVSNPNGTAPGLICQKNGKIVIALPGPKGEFDPMAHGPVKTFLEHLQGGGVIHSRVLRIIGIGESSVEDRVRHLMSSENPTVAPYAQTGEVHLRITAKAPTRADAEKMLDPLEAQIREILGDALYGINETTLPAAVIELLAARGETVAVAESMTGGDLGARLSATPGSSRAFVGGAIVYTMAAKEAALGVDDHLLKTVGPVSREVAEALARGAQERFGATYAIGITGNAGPTADVDGKPVGLAYISVATPGGVHTTEQKYRGLRQDIRHRATQQALTQLRTWLMRN